MPFTESPMRERKTVTPEQIEMYRQQREAVRKLTPAERRKSKRDAERALLPVAAGAYRPGTLPSLDAVLKGRTVEPVAGLSLAHGFPLFGPLSSEATLTQMRTCLSDERAVWGALMADHHRGYGQPVGGVVAYRRAVSLTGVGVDIGCGMAGFRLDLTAADIGVQRETLGRVRTSELERLMDLIAQTVHFGVGVDANLAPDHPLFSDPRWTVDPHITRLRDLARRQLGSVGGGNHFVDLTMDSKDRLWIVTHFGSRGFGNKAATAYLNVAQGRLMTDRAPKEDDMAPPVVCDLGTSLGDDYFTAMELACDYARVGRAAVAQQVAGLIGGRVVEAIDLNHNDARRERHDVGEGMEELIVVRKGATPIAPGLRGVVGGSMGDDLVIIEGQASVATDISLSSAMHGAGRALSRTQAAGKKDWRTGLRDNSGAISTAMMDAYLAPRGILRRGGDVDESPQAYKRLEEVVAAHGQTIRVIETLRPLGVVMAGVGDIDPY